MSIEINETEANALSLDDILAEAASKASANTSGKVTVTAETLSDTRTELEKLRAQIAELESRARNVGNVQRRSGVSTQAKPAEIDLTQRQNSWFVRSEGKPAFETMAEGMERYGLDFEVETRKSAFWSYELTDDAGEKIAGWKEASNSFKVVRTDNEAILRDNATSVLVPVQNHEILSIADALVKEFGMRWETMGMFSGGKTAYASLSFGKYSIGKDNEHEQFFNTAWSHSGKYAAQFGLGDFRIVCRNTLAAWVGMAYDKESEASQTRTKVKQTLNVGDRLSIIRQELLRSAKEKNSLKDALKVLATRKFSETMAKELLHKAFGIDDAKFADAKRKNAENQAALLDKILLENKSQVSDDLRMTGYDIMQAVTFKNTHFPSTRDTLTEGKEENAALLDDVIFRAQFEGKAQKTSENALQMLLKNNDYSTIIVPEVVYA